MLARVYRNISIVLDLLTHTLGFPHALAALAPLVELNPHR